MSMWGYLIPPPIDMNHQEIADEIVVVFSENLSEKEKELIKKIPQGLSAESPVVIGLVGPLILRSSLKRLSQNIEKADESSGKLTKAIIALTALGAIIAGTSLALEICKFFDASKLSTTIVLIFTLSTTLGASAWLFQQQK